MISFKKSIFPHFSVKIDAEHLSSIVNFSNLLQAAHAYPSGLKRHSWRENAFKEANFSKILLYILQKNFFLNFSKSQFFFIFLLIPRSWGVHRCPWFQNRSINMARTEVLMQAHMNCALSYRFLTKNFKSESTFALERRAYYFHLPRNGRQLTARALGGPDAPPPIS